jgi:5-methylcytosine-specific restriction protein A
MPRFLKVCNFAGCPERTRNVGGYCDAHTEKQQVQERSDARRKEKTNRKWYSLAIWRDIKARFRAEQPEKAVICQGTSPIDGLPCRKPARHIDHIIPFGKSWELFIDLSNLQGLCHPCHSRKTAGEGWSNSQKAVTVEDGYGDYE